MGINLHRLIFIPPPLPPAKTPFPLPPLPHANSSIQTYQTNNIERPTNALFAFMFFFFFFLRVIARAGRGMQDKELGLDVLDVSFFGWGGGERIEKIEGGGVEWWEGGLGRMRRRRRGGYGMRV